MVVSDQLGVQPTFYLKGEYQGLSKDYSVHWLRVQPTFYLKGEDRDESQNFQFLIGN